MIGLALAAVGWISVQPARAEPVQGRANDLRRPFDIPSQNAASALLTLCLEAGCQLAFVQRPGDDVRTRAVHGRMTWRAALAVMLEGSDLRYRFVGDDGVRLWIAPSPISDAPPPPDPTEVEAIEVVGRLSEQIDRAVRQKRDADMISDGLSAERIGDLPSANLAEALQRVPGVSIEREVGEGQFVSVRGLGPLFQSVTLNGAPVAFNENIRNSTQSGRQFRFRALSADLLAGARLTKSATADMTEGGIGSNIDIQTQGGLDAAPFLTVRLGGEATTRDDRISPDLSVAGRWLSPGGGAGLVAGLSQEARSVRYDRFQIMRYTQVMSNGLELAAPSDLRTTIESEDRLRRSGFVGADWLISPDLRIDFDALVSTFDNAIREDRLVFGLGERLAAPGAIQRVRDGVVTAGRVVAGRIDNNTEFSDQSHLNIAASLGGELRLGKWRVTPRLSLSSARSGLDTPLERLSSQSPLGVAYAFDLAGAADVRKASRLTTDFDLLDPSRLVLAQLNIRAVQSRDADLTLLLDAERSLDQGSGGLRFSRVKTGIQFSTRSRDYQRRDRRAVLRPSPDGVSDLYDGAAPTDVFSNLIRARPGAWITPAFDHVRANFILPDERDDIVFRPADVTPTGSDLQNSYRVEEQVAAAYLRLDFTQHGRGPTYFGNAGLRLVGTQTRVDGARMTSIESMAQVAPLTHDGKDAILLPSFNLAFDLGGDALLRLAASRTITRPSLADLRASTVPASVLVSAIYDKGQAAIDNPEPGVIFSGIGGNPDLTPYVSTNLDVSYEVTRRGASFSIALFHKTVQDFIQSTWATETLTFETRTGASVQAQVLMSRPRNVGQAAIDGLEAGVHQRLGDGLSVWASATWSNSRLADGGRLTGVSDLAWSINPYLERGPLSLNLSWSWRSPFRSEADLQGGGVSTFVVGAAGYLDAQATYRIDAHTRLSFAAANLTDTRDLAYEGTSSRLLQIGSAGRQLSFSLEMDW